MAYEDVGSSIYGPKKDPYSIYAPQPTGPAPPGYDNVVPGSDAGGVTPSGNHGAAPKKHHKKGGGGDDGLGQFQSMFEDMMAKYDKLLDAYLNPKPPEGQEPGMGFEGTVLSRRVLDEDKVNAPGLIPLYGAGQGVQQQVTDPVTGAIYPNPQAALMAGVTNWKYVPLPALGAEMSPGVPSDGSQGVA